MKYCLPALLSFALLTACSDSGSTIVPNHLSSQKMELILYDMQLADVYSSSIIKDSVHQFGNKNMDSLAKYYREILQRHGTTYQEFNKSIAWYKENPADLDSIYTRVLNKISTQSAKYDENK